MAKRNWTATAVAGIVATLLYSCGNDDNNNPVGSLDELQVQVQGCTDIAATNFIRSATQDNGSCHYDRDKLYAMQLFGVDVDLDIRTVRILLQVREPRCQCDRKTAPLDGRGVAGLTTADFVVAENGRKTGVEADLQLDTESLDFTVLGFQRVEQPSRPVRHEVVVLAGENHDRHVGGDGRLGTLLGGHDVQGL